MPVLAGVLASQGMCVFVADDVDVWTPAVVTSVKNDVITVSVEHTNQVSFRVHDRHEEVFVWLMFDVCEFC